MTTPEVTVLFALTKDGHRARAVIRPIVGSGTELQFLCDDHVVETKVYDSGGAVASAVLQKRDDLLKLGWVDVPGTWYAAQRRAVPAVGPPVT